MMQPTLVFDLDGTLADTAPDLVATLNAVLAREGQPPLPLEEVRPMIGAGTRALLERGLAAAGDNVPPERFEQLYRDFLAYYEAHIADGSQLFPGAAAALDRFHTAGWRLAVCTNKPVHLSRQLLDALGVGERFIAVCGGDSFRCRKPDPRHLLLTIEQAGGLATKAVMVGDSLSDIATAKAALVPVVAVDFGYTEVPVDKLGADIVISHFDRLFNAATALISPTLWSTQHGIECVGLS